MDLKELPLSAAFLDFLKETCRYNYLWENGLGRKVQNVARSKWHAVFETFWECVKE